MIPASCGCGIVPPSTSFGNFAQNSCVIAPVPPTAWTYPSCGGGNLTIKTTDPITKPTMGYQAILNREDVPSITFNDPKEVAKEMSEGIAKAVKEYFSEKEKKDMILGCIKNGMFRVSINGNIAVRTSNGYKTFDVETKKLVNCSDFIFDVSDDWFFTIPATKVKEGDIILINDTPKCVISVGDLIKVLNFETSTVEEIVPERHLFMGNTYFYTKVKSLINMDKKSKNPFKKIMKWKLMSQMFKDSSDNSFGKMMAINSLMSEDGSLFDMFDEDMFEEEDE